MVKYLLTALTVFAPFTPTHQVHDDFTTFETASYFNDAFADLNVYRIGDADYDDPYYAVDNEGQNYIYYAFPVYYDMIFPDTRVTFYYSNDIFNFYDTSFEGLESYIEFEIMNYDGVENNVTFGRLDADAMTTYINNEKGKDVVSDVVGTIGSMVIGLLGGLGTGIVGMFNSLFLDGSNISSLGIWIIVLLGLSIALGAVAWVSTLIRGKQR